MSAETIEIIWKVALAIFAAGGFWNELKAIRRDIRRLEQKVEKHNNFDRRIVRLETLAEEQEHLCQSSVKKAQSYETTSVKI